MATALLILEDGVVDALAGFSVKKGARAGAQVVRELFTKKLPDEFNLFQITRAPGANDKVQFELQPLPNPE